jgi:TPR repeat protein
VKSAFSVLLLCFLLASCGEEKSVEAEEAVETEKSIEGVKIMQELAEQGDAEAQFNLGVMYANGEGVPKDDVEAVKWYRKSAEQGYALAQFNLGVTCMPMAKESRKIMPKP